MIVRTTTSHTTGRWVKPFGPLLYTNNVSKMMKDEINYFAKNSKTKYNSMLAGNIEQELIYEMSDQCREELQSFVFDYMDILGEQLQMSHRSNVQPFVYIHPPWINVQKKGEWQPTHVHGGDYSCIIYSKIPKELKDEWMHPNQQGMYPSAGKIEFRYGENLPSSRCSMMLEPEEGEILLFPSWLHHHVYPFNSDVERISCSANFTLEYQS